MSLIATSLFHTSFGISTPSWYPGTCVPSFWAPPSGTSYCRKWSRSCPMHGWSAFRCDYSRVSINSPLYPRVSYSFPPRLGTLCLYARLRSAVDEAHSALVKGLGRVWGGTNSLFSPGLSHTGETSYLCTFSWDQLFFQPMDSQWKKCSFVSKLWTLEFSLPSLTTMTPKSSCVC